MLEERIFPQGMDGDSEIRSVAQGDYLLANTSNIRIFDNNGQNMGKVVNVAGTTLVTFQLPPHIQEPICIGAGSDINTGNIFYFIFNDLGNHGIYLYTPSTKSIQTVFEDNVSIAPSVLQFTKFNRINHIDLVADKLLYWTDGTIPKKLNIIKALENKARIYNLYLGANSGTGEYYTINVLDPNNVTVFTWNTPQIPNTVTDSFGVSQYIANNLPANAFVSAVAQGQFVQLTMKNIGKYTITATSSVANQVQPIAQNFYPQPYSFDIIDRLKYPPHFAPDAEYMIDNTRDTNYVQNNIFQFAVQYVYDDDEPSTLSPTSVIPDFGAQCTQSLQQSLYNYIQIDFTGDSRINNPVSKSILQYVNLYFRIGNTGNFQLIQNLQQYQFGINLDGTNPNTFNFYNDGIYEVLDTTTATTLFSAVPITNGAQEYIGNHIIDGDILEGYDNVVIDAELETTYNAPASTGFSLKGLLRIVNAYNLNAPLYQPIANTLGQFNNVQQLIFGGEHVTTQFGAWGISPNIADPTANRYLQNIPLGGFVFYLAGTNYYGVSTQVSTDFPVDPNNPNTNAVDISSQAKLDNVGIFGILEGQFYSTWQIDNIPPGVYSLRIASHLTTNTDLSASLEYQRRSTTILTQDLFPASTPVKTGIMGTGLTEIIVEILNDGTINLRDPDSYNIIVSDYDGTRTSYIQDVSQGFNMFSTFNLPGNSIDANVIMGYLVDGATTPQGTYATWYDMLGQERVTRANVVFLFHLIIVADILVSVKSDHNGFFYISVTAATFNGSIDHYFIDEITIGNNNPVQDVEPSLYDFFQYPTTFQTILGTNVQAAFGIRFYDDENITDNYRTFIDGQVLDVNSNPVSGIAVVVPYHGTFITGATGKYSIAYYSFVSGNKGLVIASSSGLCTYILSVIPYNIPNIAIDANQGDYNNSNHYIVAAFLSMITPGTLPDAFKRGGNWQFGIVYYDRGLRSGTVNNTDKTNLRIFFYSEQDPLLLTITFFSFFGFVVGDVITGNVSGATGVILVITGQTLSVESISGTFILNELITAPNREPGKITNIVQGGVHLMGEPSVSWQVRNLPPAWATHWQWVRTSNLALSYYLDWIANKADYSTIPMGAVGDANTTTYQLGKYLRIDMSNITTYFNQNATSLIAYTWTKGDRIRFIADSNGLPFTTYYDYEIVNQDAGNNTIFVANDLSLPQQFAGVEFEIYTPRLNVINKIYYEMGEEFEVGTLNGIPFHKGLSQDQDPNNPFTTPATGTFRTGDAWYRKRSVPYVPNNAIVNRVIGISDMSVSDFYASKDDNIGRINILDITAQQIQREKTLLPSGVYIQETRVNLLSWTIETDAIDIVKGDGAITKLQAVGRILLAYQPSQINSVYINEIQYVDSSGNNTLTKSDSLIGTINPLKLLTGTVNPESVQQIEGQAFHFDQRNGIIGRYADDGLFAVSDYKLASFAWNKAQELSKLSSQQGIYALGFLNPSQRQYGISFVDLANILFPVITQQTVAFNYKGKRWESPYSHLAEQYAYSNGTLVGFKNGQLWLHDSSSVYNNFYGVQYSSKISLVSNQNNSKMRKFIALVVDGSDVWYAVDVEIPASTGYPQGMSSRILAASFRRVGTDWYSPFKKDLNTPNIDPAQAIVNGRDLSGHAIIITLQNDSTSEVDLKSCGVRYLFEEFTKK